MEIVEVRRSVRKELKSIISCWRNWGVDIKSRARRCMLEYEQRTW